MKRRNFLGLSLTASAIGAAACSSGGVSQSGSGPASAKTPKTETTLKFYTDKAAWKSSIEDLDKSSRKLNLSLDFTGYSDPDDYESFIKQSFRTKKVPDLFTWHTGDALEQLVKQKAVTKTTDLWSKADTNDSIVHGIKDNYTYKGEQYGVPFNVAYWPLYYNKHVFDKYDLEPPHTWTDLMATCQKLLKHGVTPFYQTNQVFEFAWFQLLLLGKAPKVYDKLQNGEAKYTDPEVVKIAKDWGKMIDDHYFNDPGTKTEPETLLKTGKVAMAYFGTFFTGQLAGVHAKSGRDYGIFLPPNIDTKDKPKRLAIETSPLLVGSGAKHENAALAYLEWWLGSDAQHAWSEARGNAISFNPNVKAPDPETKKITAEVNKDTPSVSLHKRYQEATPTPIFNTATEVFGKFVTNGGNPMPELKKLQASADKYWKKHR